MLKVRTKVKIRKDLKADHYYGNDVFVKDMKKFLGKEGTISSSFGKDLYSVKFDGEPSGWNWTPEMFEPSTEKAIIAREYPKRTPAKKLAETPESSATTKGKSKKKKPVKKAINKVLKVGDRVQVKLDLTARKEYSDCLVTGDMVEYAGKWVFIHEVTKYDDGEIRYYIEPFGTRNWTIEMFTPYSVTKAIRKRSK